MKHLTFRAHQFVAAAAVVTSSVALVGCGSDASTTASVSSVPSGGDGMVLYEKSCASCHGADLRGTEKGPSHLSEVYKSDHHGDDAFRNAVANGSPRHHWTFGDMPAVPGLSASDVEAIVAYVRAQQAANGFEPYPASP